MAGRGDGGEPEPLPAAPYHQANMGDAVYAVQYGNQYIDQRSYQGGGPGFSIEPFPLDPPAPPSAMMRRRPSWLLAARNQIVDFTGRAEELDGLSAWRDDAEVGIGVRLVHGPGGQGKTRLAAKFAHQSARAGWTVALARHRSEPTRSTSHLDLRQLAGTAGLLLVVDYAERWPRSDLLGLFQDPLLRQGVPVRVLLLARPAGQWWASLQHPLGILDVIADHLLLPTLADNEQQRRLLFDAARDRFVTLLDVGDSERIGPPGPLTAEGYRLVLTVHMAALAAVDAHARHDRAPADPAALSAYLLNRERHHWQAMYDNDQRVTTPPDQLARAVLVATLAGPLTYPDGIGVLDQVGVGPAAQVAGDHAICYPPADRASILEPLYPDRLGEDFLALQTPGHHTSYQADPWAATALSELLTPAVDVETNEPQPPPAYVGRAITVLAEAGRRWPHLGDRLHAILRAQPAMAVAAGGATLTTLATTVPIDLLEAIEPHLPTGRHVDLDAGIAAIIQRLTSHRLDRTNDPVTRYLLLGRLDYRLGNAGLYQEALAATLEAAEILRRLAVANPAAFEPDLGSALGNIGARLLALGRPAAAVAAVEDAVKVFRRLATANPAAFDFQLAMALSNLGIGLSELRRHEAALEVTQEAVRTYRRLAAANPTAHAPNLAMALTNLGRRLSELRRHKAALEVTQEAVKIDRWLVAANWNAHAPDLAMALSNLGGQLSECGRRKAAVAAVHEAVKIFRQLAAANPTAFDPELAKALGHLGSLLSELERHEAALEATQEAVDIYRRLAAANPMAFEARLAQSLWTFVSVRVAAGTQLEDALSAVGESIQIYLRLAAVRPDAFAGRLVGANRTAAEVLERLGRTEEAAVIRRDLGDEDEPRDSASID
jgi:tetratricopeptide (TPR) repeat protein